MDDLLGQITLPEKVYPLCVRPDLHAQWETAEADLVAAQLDGLDSLSGTSRAATSAAKRVQQLEAEIAEHTVPLKLRALSHKAWSDLIAKCPPREDTDDRGWNTETFPVEMLAACAAEPEMNIDQAGTLVDRLTMGQWNELATVLYGLNTNGVDIPKSRRASEVLRSSKKK